MSEDLKEVENQAEGLEEKVEKETKRMKLYMKDFGNPKDNKIVIVPFGDLHYGSKYCDIKSIKKVIKWINETPNTYVIGMGDFLETGTKHSVAGSVFEQNKFLQEQFEGLTEELKPLAKKGKILGLLTGNHEKRIYNESGLDLGKLIAKELDVPYFGNGIFMKLKIGEQNYTLYATHGSSGSKLPYTKVKAVLDLARFIDVDIYCYGHVHELQHHAQSYYKIDTKNKCVKEYDKHFILTGSYLDYWNSYSEEKNMLPGKKGSPKIKLHSDNKEIRVSL